MACVAFANNSLMACSALYKIKITTLINCAFYCGCSIYFQYNQCYQKVENSYYTITINICIYIYIYMGKMFWISVSGLHLKKRLVAEASKAYRGLFMRRYDSTYNFATTRTTDSS